MTTIALAPDVKGLTKIASKDKARWRAAKKDNTAYEWSVAYWHLVWTRILIVLFMMITPLVAVGVLATPLALLGYLPLLAVPAREMLSSGKTSHKRTDVMAYDIIRQLRDGWKDHAEVFYRQLWAHECKDSGYSTYTDDYDRRGYRKANELKYTNCAYCDKRLVELNALLDSQRSVEKSILVPIEHELFESSEQFRKAIAEQSKPSDIMKAISEGVKNG